MVYVVAAVVALWLLVGATVGVIEARHGHWHRGWIVAAIFGPFAIALARERRRLAVPEPVVVDRGRARHGRVDVLVGVDGSASSTAAAELAVSLLGGRVGRLALATVIDLDTATPHGDSTLYPNPWPEERAASEHLDAAARALRDSGAAEPSAVVLAGDPAEALERYALDEGYDVIVVGCRGTGLSKLLLGSCASRLAGKTSVPVLLVPHEPVLATPGGGSPAEPPASG